MTAAAPTGIAPVLLVADLSAALRYWREKVGFAAETYGEPPDFAILSRGAARLMLQAAPAGATILPNWRVREKTSDVFIWVDDARALYDELRDRGATIDWELYEAPYGALEFGIQDIDDHDIAFAQLLR